MRAHEKTRAIVRWYFYEGRVEGVPFYCDPARIGTFAVEPEELASGSDAAVFRLFITLSMYQALRDVVIMRIQHSFPRSSMRVVADVARVKRSILRHACPMLGSVEVFEEGCDGREGRRHHRLRRVPRRRMPREGRDANLQPHG